MLVSLVAFFPQFSASKLSLVPVNQLDATCCSSSGSSPPVNLELHSKRFLCFDTEVRLFVVECCCLAGFN